MSDPPTRLRLAAQDAETIASVRAVRVDRVGDDWQLALVLVDDTVPACVCSLLGDYGLDLVGKDDCSVRATP